jgi:hypothetical protein
MITMLCQSRLARLRFQGCTGDTWPSVRHKKVVDLGSMGLSLNNLHSTESSHFAFLCGQRSTSEKRGGGGGVTEVLYLPNISIESTVHAHLGGKKEKRSVLYVAILIDILPSILREVHSKKSILGGLCTSVTLLYPVFNFWAVAGYPDVSVAGLNTNSVFGYSNVVIYLLLTPHFFIWFVK